MNSEGDENLKKKKKKKEWTLDLIDERRPVILITTHHLLIHPLIRRGIHNHGVAHPFTLLDEYLLI
jgi:hypothetical protein